MCYSTQDNIKQIFHKKYVTKTKGGLMDIQVQTAHKIVHSMKKIIKQDLNFMNSQGTIIASTDENRINQFHEAALKCIKEHKTIIIESDQIYIGSKPGINIPVFFNHQVIGVIGITGKPNEVEPYAQVIKQMTEILILENWQRHSHIRQREFNRAIIENLIFQKNHTSQTIFSLSIDSQLNFACYKIQPNVINQIDLKEKLLSELEKNPKFGQSLYATFIDMNLILLFINHSQEEIEIYLKELIYKFERTDKIDLCFGVSDYFYSNNQTLEYLNQSQLAQKWSHLNHSKCPVSFYDEMNLGILLLKIEKDAKIRFKNQILKNIPQEDFYFYKDLIQSYGQLNGSIGKIANHFSMHKNTVQYQLNRLRDLTGYNPRHYDDFCILKLAFMMDDFHVSNN